MPERCLAKAIRKINQGDLVAISVAVASDLGAGASVGCDGDNVVVETYCGASKEGCGGRVHGRCLRECLGAVEGQCLREKAAVEALR